MPDSTCEKSSTVQSFTQAVGPISIIIIFSRHQLRTWDESRERPINVLWKLGSFFSDINTFWNVSQHEDRNDLRVSRAHSLSRDDQTQAPFIMSPVYRSTRKKPFDKWNCANFNVQFHSTLQKECHLDAKKMQIEWRQQPTKWDCKSSSGN